MLSPNWVLTRNAATYRLRDIRCKMGKTGVRQAKNGPQKHFDPAFGDP